MHILFQTWVLLLVCYSRFFHTCKQAENLFEFSWWEHGYIKGSLIIISITSSAPQLHRSCSNLFLPCYFRRKRMGLFYMSVICRGYACILVCLESHVSHIKMYETKFQVIMSTEWILWGTSMECTVLYYPASHLHSSAIPIFKEDTSFHFALCRNYN